MSLFACLSILLVGTHPSYADPIAPVRSADLLKSVKGSVYIGDSSSSSGKYDWITNGQYWDGSAWRNLSSIGTYGYASLPEGWRIGWYGDNTGGIDASGYHIYRQIDKRLPDSGERAQTFPGFKIRFNDVGYTSQGEHIDSIIEFTRVKAWQKRDAYPPAYGVRPFEISQNDGPFLSARSIGDSPIGVDSTYSTIFVKSGTDTRIDDGNTVDIVYWDIDQPVHTYRYGSDDFKSPYREGVGLINGYRHAALDTSTSVKTETEDGNTWFRSGQVDDSPVPHNVSSVVTEAGPSFTTEWRGENCVTGIGYDTKVIQYPAWDSPHKTLAPRDDVPHPGATQILKRTDKAAFDVRETFPYVSSSNQARSITMTDILDPGFDASKAIVTVSQITGKDRNGNEIIRDVSSNWTIRLDAATRTITASAKNTGHGFAESTHIFHIVVPVSATADLTRHDRDTIDGKPYWRIPNTASVTIVDANGVPNEKRTETVHVDVPYEAKGSVELKALKKVKGHDLHADQFIFILTDPAGKAVDSEKNRGDGSVVFKPLEFTQDDIGKSYQYAITEMQERVDGYVFDSHKEIITITVADAGNGKLAVTPVYDADGETFTNIYKTSLEVMKRSDKGQALAQAGFTLYQDNGDGRFGSDDQAATVYSDPGLTTTINQGYAVTDSSGTILYHGLNPEAVYWLKETKAPSGYNLDPHAYKLSISAQGKMTISHEDGSTADVNTVDDIYSVTITDSKIKTLPSTSGPGILYLVFAGAFLLVLGLGSLLGRRKRNR
ncbi:MAG: SpaA isopeptide-forming pilin-related protein [Parascardovia denticolens]